MRDTRNDSTSFSQPLGVVGWFLQVTCTHKWIRARWPDGSYGLRCQLCMKAYRGTWNSLIAQRLSNSADPIRTRCIVGEPADASLRPKRAWIRKHWP
jgi:hypothetical protein